MTARSPIRTQGTVRLKIASLMDSVANDQENENRLMWVRAVDSAVRKWSNATTGTSGEFNSSRPNNLPAKQESLQGSPGGSVRAACPGRMPSQAMHVQTNEVPVKDRPQR